MAATNVCVIICRCRSAQDINVLALVTGGTCWLV